MKFLRLTALLLLVAVLTAGVISCQSASEASLPTLPSGTLEEILPPSDPEALEESFRDAFAGLYTASAQDLTLETLEGKLTLVKYKGSEKRVQIPQTVDGKPIEAIAPEAFAETGITVLVLPDSRDVLSKGALDGCTALEALSVTLPKAEDCDFLGYLFGASDPLDNARDVPASLKLLRLTGSEERLADYALFDCNDLVCVALPESTRELGAYSLYGCSALRLCDPEGVERIGEGAFGACASLEELVFSEKLTSIGFGALTRCDALRRLTLPFVGGSATENTYLAYLFGAETPDFAKGYYPASLQEVILLSGCTTLGDYAFFEFEQLRRVSLPNGLEKVGVRAFAGCRSLTELSFGEGLAEIRENAFLGCERLEQITLGESLSKIGINAFYGCLSLREIKLPAGLEALPASCFADCISLSKVDLGGVKTVGKNAFRNCVALERLISAPDVKFESGNDLAKRLH